MLRKGVLWISACSENLNLVQYRLKNFSFVLTDSPTLDHNVNGFWFLQGQETYVVGSSQQCPFFDELHAVLSASANDMHQTQFDYEVAMMRGKKRLKKVNRYQSAEEEDDESDAD